VAHEPADAPLLTATTIAEQPHVEVLDSRAAIEVMLCRALSEDYGNEATEEAPATLRAHPWVVARPDVTQDRQVLGGDRLKAPTARVVQPV
jgi:hypothetical protein